jgi:pimeloyl-ACP methyl ester carboxylesterase
MQYSIAASQQRLRQTQLAQLSQLKTINWTPCRNNPTFDCGLLSVPIDYQSPSKGYIGLPVSIHRTKPGVLKLGTIILNFGGPWGDDITALQMMFSSFTPSVQNNYDLVTFNPRGVVPNGISCHAENMKNIDEILRQLSLTDFSTTEGVGALYDDVTQQRSLCIYDNLAKYASTKNTIQDMDMLRQALPQVNKIDYLGYSYGTRLGLAYLLKYPQHTNKMLLDSNIAPVNDLSAFMKSYAYAGDNVLHSFFQFCAESSLSQCALYEKTTKDIAAKYQTLVDKIVERAGMPTSATYYQRPFTAAMLEITMEWLINTPSEWPQIAQALQSTMLTNNADALMKFYILVTGYIPVSNTFKTYSYNNVVNAVIHKDYSDVIACNNKTDWLESTKYLRQNYPLVGGSAATSIMGDVCIHWPEPSEALLPTNPTPIIDATPTVLIVNDLYDPKTPLSSAEELSTYLTNLHVTNKLLTWEGVGHESYASSSPNKGCIDKNVNDFFATEPGQLPLITICNDKVNPFIYPYSQHGTVSLSFLGL